MSRYHLTGILLLAAISMASIVVALDEVALNANDVMELGIGDQATSQIMRTHRSIPDDEDASREYTVVDGEKIQLPRKLPKLSWKEKEAILLANGINKTEIAQRRHRKRQRVSRKATSKKRRSLNSESVWRRQRVIGPAKPEGPPVSADLQQCPHRIDAVTQAHNHRTYVFSNEFVHQIYRDRDGLQQKGAFLITDMFPAGPRRVNAAFTNLKSAVTVLIERDTVYRFRWNKKNQKFYLARKSPQKLDRNITFTPTLAFQWSDGNMIISDGSYFSTYDPYWNVATFTGHTKDYFPGLPRDAIGLVHDGGDSFLWMNDRAHVMVYNMKKFRIVQEYPVRISDYIACLSKRKA